MGLCGLYAALAVLFQSPDLYLSGPVLGAGHTDLDQACGHRREGRLNPMGRSTLEGFSEEVRFELRLEEWGGGG